MRVVGDARHEERKWEALWSYRANVPTEGEGKQRRVVTFKNFLAQLGLADKVKREPETITDAEMERLEKAGLVRREGVIPH